MTAESSETPGAAQQRSLVRVLFLIRSLDRGGAERQLVALVRGLDKKRFAVTVVSFYSGGSLRAELTGLEGVELRSLEKLGRWDVTAFFPRLWRVVREVRPDVVHGYMGVANELALLAGKPVGARVVWGLRASNFRPVRDIWMDRTLLRLGSKLSRFADLIIVNSMAGREYYEGRGYEGARMTVIRNGIDTEHFCPDVESGRRARDSWGIGAKEQLVGLVGRLDAIKDHPTFLRAAALCREHGHRVLFVCVGGGPPGYLVRMQALAAELGISDVIRWAGERSDMPGVYNALDVSVSSSTSEGFPNIVGEAMACGVPCVVTDVGDSAVIVGNPDQVVPPRNSAALAQALMRILSMPPRHRAVLSRLARDTVVARYNHRELVYQTERAIASLLLPT
jgi:glycosyltransferase involved in cell wall biosynthesis